MKQIVVIRLDLKLTGAEQIQLAAQAAALGISQANPAAVKEWNETGPEVEILYVKSLRDLLFVGMRDGLNRAFVGRNGDHAAVAIGPAAEGLFSYIDGFQGR